MTPGIVDTGQHHSRQQSQQDQDDEDYHQHPRVTTEPDVLVLMIYSDNLQTGLCPTFLGVVFSLRAEHLYGIGIKLAELALVIFFISCH